MSIGAEPLRPDLSFREANYPHMIERKFIHLRSILFLSAFLFSWCGAQWERVPEIPQARAVYSLLAVHDTLYAGTDSVVYVGTNGGSQWSSGVSPLTSHDAVACLRKFGSVLLAGTFKSGIFKSTNEGLSWKPFSTGLSGLGSLDISAILVRRDSLIAGTLGAGVFITSTDFAHAWSAWGDSIIEYQGDNVFTMTVIGNTVLANAGGNGYMFRYTDDQPWWNPLPINTPRLVGQSVSGMATGPATVIAGTNGALYRSTDEGLSWERSSATIPPMTFRILPVYHDTTVFAVTTSPTSSSLMISGDDGATWQSIGEIPLTNILSVAIAGETFYLGRVDGLWEASLSQLSTHVLVETSTAAAFSLAQNYPNPFNPTTTIGYQLSERSFVRLKIFDILGREVATLANGEELRGAHNVQWSGADVPSGVYFYRIQIRPTGGAESMGLVLTKKLLLVR